MPKTAMMKMKAALICADADLQGAIERGDLTGDNLDAAKETRADIKEAIEDSNEKPYTQGFNPETGDIVIVCSPEDVQEALAVERMVDGDDEVRMTITREKAIELMKDNEEALTYAYHHGWNGEWAESIRDVLGDGNEADLTEVWDAPGM